MKKIAICYSSSNEYCEYSGISLLSLLENSDSNLIDKVYYLSFGVKQENRNKLEEIASKYSVKLVFIEAASVMKDVFSQIRLDSFEGSYATYARAFIEMLIPDYNGLLLLIDSDTIVDRSIAELISFSENDIHDKVFAAVIGANQYYVGNPERILLNHNHKYFQCGVLLFNMAQLHEYGYTNRIIRYIKKNGSSYRFADQTIINNVVDEDRILSLPPKFNYWGHAFRGTRLMYEMHRGGFWTKSEINEAINNPVIIHYNGQIVRPWLTDNESLLSDRYIFYKKRSPWADSKMVSIYYDEKAGNETEKMKREMAEARKRIRTSGIYLLVLDSLRTIKRTITREFR